MITREELTCNQDDFYKLGINKLYHDTIYCICQGMSNKQIADIEKKSVKTIKFRITIINRLLGTKSRLQIAKKTVEMCRKW